MPTIWMPDYPPETPSAYDDEFTDESYNAVLWTEFDKLDYMTITEPVYGLQLNLWHAGGNDVSGVVLTPPAGDWSAWVKCSNWPWNGNYSGAGLGIWQGTGNTDDIVRIGYVTLDTGVPNLQVQYFTTYGTIDSVPGTTITDAVMSMTLYFRIRWVDSTDTAYFDYSVDGIGWQNIGSRVCSGWTPLVGPSINCGASSQDTQGVFQFFRLVEGSAALTDVMPGRRIDPDNPPTDGGQPMMLRRMMQPMSQHWTPRYGGR